ncbi:hypothetical protein ACP275_04G053900 [Erythranthe tilingii]
MERVQHTGSSTTVGLRWCVQAVVGPRYHKIRAMHLFITGPFFLFFLFLFPLIFNPILDSASDFTLITFPFFLKKKKKKPSLSKFYSLSLSKYINMYLMPLFLTDTLFHSIYLIWHLLIYFPFNDFIFCIYLCVC